MNRFTLELLAQKTDDYGTFGSLELEVVSHVNQYIDRFIYKRTLLPGSVGLYYIENLELDSDTSLVLANRTYGIPANSIQISRYRGDWDTTRARSYTSTYREILATNKTYLDRNNQIHPLFWKHKLQGDALNVKINKVTNLDTKQIDDGWFHEEETDYLFTSFVNSFNETTMVYELYFITYNLSTGESVSELLNSFPACEEATWEDIDLDTGFLNSDHPVFYRTDAASSWLYSFSQPGPWYIKPVINSLIQPIMPTSTSSRSPWFLHFNAGELFAQVNDRMRKYKVTEYDLQSYVPYKPLRFQIQDKLKKVNINSLQTSRKSIWLVPGESLNLQIMVYDADNQLVKIYTSDTTKEGLKYQDTDIFYEIDKILGYDSYTGIVNLAADVYSGFSYYGSYYYSSKDYELTTVALNPLYNKRMKDHMIVFYLVPEVDDLDKSIHWLLVNQSGNIVECSQDDTGIQYQNLQLFNLDNTYNTDTVIGLPYISDIDTDTFSTRYLADYDNDNAYMLLAECTVNHNALVENQYLVDVRTDKQFGTNFETLRTIYTKNPKLLHSKYGFGPEGLTVPENKVVIVEPQLTLLEDYGGDLTPEQVEKLLYSSVPASTQLVINYVYPYSTLSADSATAGEVALTATWEGPDLTYKFYRQETDIDVATLIQTVIDPVEGDISYTDAGLTSDKVYTYSITIVDNGIEFPANDRITIKVR